MKKKLKILSYFVRIPIAIIISPILYLFFKISPNKLFFHTFSALWPHLTILDEKNKPYLTRFFFTPKCKWYRPRFLHHICQSDKSRDPHDHPGPFKTTVLSGGYVESVYYPRTEVRMPRVHSLLPGMSQFNPEGHTHKVDLIAPTWSWVIGWNRGKPWGFWRMGINALDDVWVESEEYGNKGEEVMSWE